MDPTSPPPARPHRDEGVAGGGGVLGGNRRQCGDRHGVEASSPAVPSSATPRRRSDPTRARPRSPRTSRCHWAPACIVVPNAAAASAQRARSASTASSPLAAACHSARLHPEGSAGPCAPTGRSRVRRGRPARTPRSRAAATPCIVPCPGRSMPARRPVARSNVAGPLHAHTLPGRIGAMTEARTNPDDLDALRAASDILGIDALLSADERARPRPRARLRRRRDPAPHRRLVRPRRTSRSNSHPRSDASACSA